MGTNKSGKKGQTIILVALLITVLLLFVGIAIDSGIGYGAKAKLSSAVDAAALAAGKALGQPGTDAGRIANATLAAETFFAANFPDGYLMATPTLQDIVISPDDPSPGQWRITVTASATVPTIFLRLGGRNTFTAQAEAGAVRRDLDMVLVLDCSLSLGSSFTPLQTAAINFIDNFIDGPGGDRVGLVSFGGGAVSDVPINKDSTRGFDKTAVTSAISALEMGGSTASEEAIRRAKQELDDIPANDRSSLRVIVFFSDGAPNIVSGTFPYNGGSPPSPVAGSLWSELSGSESAAADTMWRYDSRDACKCSRGSCSSSQCDCNSGSNSSRCQWYGSYSGINYSIPSLPTYDYTGTIPLASYDGRRSLTMSGGNILNTRCNVNRAARNMAENVSNMARSESPQPIHIYAIGLGAALNSVEISGCGYTSAENGANILKRLANTTDSDNLVTVRSTQPNGIYAYAADASQLNAAFNAVASKILRLTK